MASLQSSRTLGSRVASSRLSEPALARVSESESDEPSAAVHDGADSFPSSAFESPGPEAGIKRQRILDSSTGQDVTAPDGDDAAPQEKLSDGAVPHSQLAWLRDMRVSSPDCCSPWSQSKWTWHRMRLISW